MMTVAIGMVQNTSSKNGSLRKNKSLNRLDIINPIPAIYQSLYFLSFIVDATGFAFSIFHVCPGLFLLKIPDMRLFRRVKIAAYK
jgi:hypothetical protein